MTVVGCPSSDLLFRFTLHVILLEEEIVVRIFLHVEFSDALVEERLEFFDIRFLACRNEDAVIAYTTHPSVVGPPTGTDSVTQLSS